MLFGRIYDFHWIEHRTQLSRKITGIKKISKTWDVYQSILYTSVYYFLKKTKFFNPGFFSTDQLVVLPYKPKCCLRGKIIGRGKNRFDSKIELYRVFSAFAPPDAVWACI